MEEAKKSVFDHCRRNNKYNSQELVISCYKIFLEQNVNEHLGTNWMSSHYRGLLLYILLPVLWVIIISGQT